MLKALSKLVKKVTGKTEAAPKPVDEAIVKDKVVVKKGTKLSRAVRATKKKPNALK